MTSIVPASTLFAPYSSLYGQMLDALSMRQFRPVIESGHDHFFNTFGKFSAVSRAHVPEMLTEDVWRLASENVDYLETIFAPDFGKARDLMKLVTAGQSMSDARTAIMQSGQVPPIITASRAVIDGAEARMRSDLHCGTPNAQPGCDSTVRYLYELHRGVPLPQLFVEMIVGYELASADPRVVGLNPVMPEDSYISMHDFDEQMRMFAFFHQLYPKVHLTTHAGELTPGLVQPEGLRNHIRDSVMIAGAQRIGHGVDIGFEDDAAGLLSIMATRHVAVEVCLTSNDVILGVSGKAHPLRLYLAAGVPVALATDDPGVSRRHDEPVHAGRAGPGTRLRHAQEPGAQQPRILVRRGRVALGKSQVRRFHCRVRWQRCLAESLQPMRNVSREQHEGAHRVAPRATATGVRGHVEVMPGTPSPVA